MKRRKSSRKCNRQPNATKKKYTVVVGTQPSDLDTGELAVLLGMVARLTSYKNIPGFDPTKVTLTLEFDSGHVGVAKLAEPSESDQPLVAPD